MPRHSFRWIPVLSWRPAHWLMQVSLERVDGILHAVEAVQRIGAIIQPYPVAALRLPVAPDGHLHCLVPLLEVGGNLQPPLRQEL